MQSTMPPALRLPPAITPNLDEEATPAIHEQPDRLRLLDRKLAAASLGISVRHLDTLTAQGMVRSVKVGERRLYRPLDLDQYVQSLGG